MLENRKNKNIKLKLGKHNIKVKTCEGENIKNIKMKTNKQKKDYIKQYDAK